MYAQTPSLVLWWHKKGLFDVYIISCSRWIKSISQMKYVTGTRMRCAHKKELFTFDVSSWRGCCALNYLHFFLSFISKFESKCKCLQCFSLNFSFYFYFFFVWPISLSFSFLFFLDQYYGITLMRFWTLYKDNNEIYVRNCLLF